MVRLFSLVRLGQHLGSAWKSLPQKLRSLPVLVGVKSEIQRRFASASSFDDQASLAIPPGHPSQGLSIEVQDVSLKLPAKIRVITTIEQLDSILEELDEAAAVSDDALRLVFPTFKMEVASEASADPYSLEYRKAQFGLYEKLAGKPYQVTNEVSEFDVESAVSKPFPFYTRSAITVGNHLIAIGNLIKVMALPPGARILEFGPGWGNTTLWLAQMGYRVTAVDIERRFVDLIRERAKQASLDIETIQGDFQLIHSLQQKWDAVLFFECFHHCADHQELIRGLKRVLEPTGKIVFGAEPITDDFPIPWGLRLDGESLWAIRKFGWCELGFQETYFRDLLARNGWNVSKYVCPETPWGTVFLGTLKD